MLDTTSKLKLTKHAALRCQQRGIRRDVLATMIFHADIEVSVGGGSSLLQVSRDLALELNLDDRLFRVGAILSGDGAVITAAYFQNNRRGKTWRRGRK